MFMFLTEHPRWGKNLFKICSVIQSSEIYNLYISQLFLNIYIFIYVLKETAN